MPSPPLVNLEGFGRILERHRYVQEDFTEAEVAVPRDAFVLGGKKAPMSPSDQSNVSTQAEEGDSKLAAHTATRVSSAEASSICQNILAELHLDQAASQPEGERPALGRGEASSLLHSILAELSLASPPPPGGEPQPSTQRADRQDTGRSSSWMDSLSTSRSSSSSSCAQRQVPLSGLFLEAAASTEAEALGHFPKVQLSGLFGEPAPGASEAGGHCATLSSRRTSPPTAAAAVAQRGRQVAVASAGRPGPPRQMHIPRLDFATVRGRFAGPVEEAFAGPVCEESYSSYRQRGQVDPCSCQVNLQCGHLLDLL